MFEGWNGKYVGRSSRGMFLTRCPSMRSVGTRNLTINISQDSQPPGGTCNVGIPVNYALTIAADKIFLCSIRRTAVATL